MIDIEREIEKMKARLTDEALARVIKAAGGRFKPGSTVEDLRRDLNEAMATYVRRKHAEQQAKRRV